MDEELIGRFNGYAQWAAEVHWNRRTDEVQKQQIINTLRANRNAGFTQNKAAVDELKAGFCGKCLITKGNLSQ